MADDDDDDDFCHMYDNGHWIWDDRNNNLFFISHYQPPVYESKPNIILSKDIVFRDDIDLMEQLRYRRRYQRKTSGTDDFITIQDVKDIAIYTAPIGIMSVKLINMLHQLTTDRFLRALIMYLQYFLQISKEMAVRIEELETKIRSKQCDIIENEFRDNLSDMRLLVAKEYFSLLTGGGDMKQYHHMGVRKTANSLSGKDAKLSETFLRMCLQIVWLALGRKAFTQIEAEIHRLVKSSAFCGIEHKTNLESTSLPKEMKRVLYGMCVHKDFKINMKSPLINELYCHSSRANYRLLGLGVIDLEKLSPRFEYFLSAVHGPEEKYLTYGITVGVLGLPRSTFTTMLYPLAATDKDSRISQKSSVTAPRSKSRVSQVSLRRQIYPDIRLPTSKVKKLLSINIFPSASKRGRRRRCNESQRQKWQERLQRRLRQLGSACSRWTNKTDVKEMCYDS